ncbi:hypothetical protein [Dickeya dadantii]|uniref:hypothetical protein n=1 Tax=Dickeya dadantii TaxID=204038 RepID=UPI001F43BB52|nr:hypothetical protein [Dickeya dadantii]
MTGRESMTPPAWQRFSRLRLAQTRWHCLPEQLPEPELPRFERQLLRSWRWSRQWRRRPANSR